jgi:co-chaperonin GroES (HSP10)
MNETMSLSGMTASGVLVPGKQDFTAADQGLFSSISGDDSRSTVGFTPFLDRVLVRAIKTEAQFRLLMRGGFKLDLRQQDQRDTEIGEVVGIGDCVPMGGCMVPIPCKLGEIVRYGRYGMEPIILNAEDELDGDAPKYFLIRVADLKGRLSPNVVSALKAIR